MDATEHYIPQDSEYAWIQDFFDNGKRVNLPNGRTLLLCPHDRNSPAFFFGNGVEALLISVGTDNATHDSIGIPWQKRFILMGRSWLSDPTGNKQFSQFTDADCDTVTDYWFNLRQVKYLTSDADEEYGGNNSAAIRDRNPSAWLRIQKLLGQKATARGQFYYGNYSGSVKEPNQISIAQARSILSSGANCLAWLKSNPSDGSGGYSGQEPYWGESLYNFGVHTIVNCYARGPFDDRVKAYQMLFPLLVARAAMTETGTSQRIMAYTEGVNSEFTGYSAYWYFDVQNGGFMETTNFPSLAFGYMLFQYFAIYLTCEDNGCWKEISLFGRDTNIVQNDQPNGQGYFPHFYRQNGSNNSPQRQEPTIWTNRDEHPVPHPNRPLGFENAPMIAANWYRSAFDHVGNANYYWPAISVQGGNSATPGPGNSMLADIYERGLPYAFYGTDGGGKRWLIAYYVRPDNGPQWVTATFNMAGLTADLTLCSGVPRFFTYA